MDLPQQDNKQDPFDNRLRTVFDAFLPVDAGDLDNDVRRRLRLAIAFIIVLAILATTFACIYFAADAYLPGTVLLIGVSISPLFLMVAKKTGSPTLVGNLVTLDSFVSLLGITFFLDGIAGPIPIWLSALPLLVMCTCGRRWTIVWCIVISLTYAALLAAEHLGVQFVNQIEDHHNLILTFNLIGVTLLVTSIAFIYEVTRARTMDRLEEEMMITSAAIDTMPGLFCMIDPQGHITRWNAEFAAVMNIPNEGTSMSEIMGFFHPDDRALAENTTLEAMKTGQGAFEARLSFPDGQFVPMFLNGKMCEIGDERFLIGTGIDISSQKQVEKELHDAKEVAESANRSKSEFLANMSHEIRTPMTAILGFADELSDSETLQEHAPDLIDAAQTIKRNGQYLLGIINDILDLSKIEAGKMSVEIIPCDIDKLLNEVLSLIQVRADAKGLDLRLMYRSAIPKEILTDPTRLRQILINLLGNAVKFTNKGHISVVASCCKSNGMNVMRFDISDTGIGMTDTQIDKLFQPFNQADTSTTRQYGGTGLGLTISRRLAKMLGGDIVIIKSKPGHGTHLALAIRPGIEQHVEMIMPNKHSRIETADNKVPSDADTPLPLDNVRILLAEDGPDNQKLISMLLHKAGADVTVVENGQQAKDIVLRDNRQTFDVVLMDMQMPVLDGYQATRQLRNAGYVVPIIALTAHAMKSDKDKCIAAGCTDYISKPIDRTTLIKTIDRALQNHISTHHKTNREQGSLG